MSLSKTIVVGALAVALGAMLAVVTVDPAAAAGVRPLFQLPFRCGEQWMAETRANHKPNPNSLDMTKVGGGSNGSPILASAAGTVTFADDDPGGGWMVNIAHANGWGTSYLHMIERPAVSAGQSVTQGQQIGRVGSTGDSDGPHLHYQQWADTPSNTVRAMFNGVLVNVSVGQSETLTSHNCGAGSGPRDDIAWFQQGVLFTFSGSTLTTVGSVSGFGQPTWADVGDYNHDGREDIFWFYSDGTIHVVTSTGNSFTSIGRVRGPGLGAPSWARTGDFDGNGFRDDIAWFQQGVLFTFSGSTLTTVGSVSGFGQPTWADVGDYNHDGREDIFWFYSDGTIHVVTSTGNNFTSIGRIRGPGIGTPSWAATGDFDGNGFRDDIAWYQQGVLFTFSGSTLTTVGSVTGFGQPTWADVGDYNHDGREDIFWFYSDGTIHVVTSTGTTFTSIGRIRGPGIGTPSWARAGNFR